MDLGMIHEFLSEESYWKKGVAIEVVRKSLLHSMCFGGFIGLEQVAFARLVTDYVDFAYVRDVFVLPAYRGKGYSKQLMRAVLAHPELQTINWLLKTEDAQTLYEQFGFAPMADPELYMRRPAGPARTG